MNPHLVILPFSRKRYQSANWLVFVNIRKRNFFYSVASHHIRIHSGFLCTLAQFAQVFRLNSVYIHKMYHCHHSKEKEWKGKGRFYRETGFFYLLFYFFPKGAQRHFSEKTSGRKRGLSDRPDSQRTLPSCSAP